MNRRAGLVTGYATDANGENGHGVVWSATNQPRILTLPAGFNHANDIDDDDTVVGIIQDWDWPNAGVRAQEASGISVAALTNTRQLYGTDGFTHQAVRWDCN